MTSKTKVFGTNYLISFQSETRCIIGHLTMATKNKTLADWNKYKDLKEFFEKRIRQISVKALNIEDIPTNGFSLIEYDLDDYPGYIMVIYTVDAHEDVPESLFLKVDYLWKTGWEKHYLKDKKVITDILEDDTPTYLGRDIVEPIEMIGPYVCKHCNAKFSLHWTSVEESSDCLTCPRCGVESYTSKEAAQEGAEQLEEDLEDD